MQLEGLNTYNQQLAGGDYADIERYRAAADDRPRRVNMLLDNKNGIDA
jgi:hypothetical protein